MTLGCGGRGRAKAIKSLDHVTGRVNPRDDVAHDGQISQNLSLAYVMRPLTSVVATMAACRAAIVNLLVNALQAMAGGGRLDVAISLDDMAVVEIRDTGPGIPLEIRDRVFEPFLRPRRAAAVSD